MAHGLVPSSDWSSSFPSVQPPDLMLRKPQPPPFRSFLNRCETPQHASPSSPSSAASSSSLPAPVDLFSESPVRRVPIPSSSGGDKQLQSDRIMHVLRSASSSSPPAPRSRRHDDDMRFCIPLHAPPSLSASFPATLNLLPSPTRRARPANHSHAGAAAGAAATTTTVVGGSQVSQSNNNQPATPSPPRTPSRGGRRGKMLLSAAVAAAAAAAKCVTPIPSPLRSSTPKLLSLKSILKHHDRVVVDGGGGGGGGDDDDDDDYMPIIFRRVKSCPKKHVRVRYTITDELTGETYVCAPVIDRRPSVINQSFPIPPLPIRPPSRRDCDISGTTKRKRNQSRNIMPKVPNATVAGVPIQLQLQQQQPQHKRQRNQPYEMVLKPYDHIPYISDDTDMLVVNAINAVAGNNVSMSYLPTTLPPPSTNQVFTFVNGALL